MHRILRTIAIAILALMGPVEVARTMMGPAEVACACCCGATSGAACECSDKSMPSQNPTQTDSQGFGSSSCSTTSTPCSASLSTTSTGLVGQSQGKRAFDSEKRPEPKPWPGTVAQQIPGGLEPALRGRCEASPNIHPGRPLDRLATLAVFRI